MNAQARISLFIPLLEGGGAERAMVNIARGLSEKGHAVDLVLVKAEGPYLDDVHPQVRVVELRSRGTLAALPRLVRYLKRERPIALLSTLQHANVIAACARKISGVPTRLLVLEDNTLTGFAVTRNTWKQRITYHLMRWTYPWADLVVAHSQDTSRGLLRHGAARPGTMRIVPYPLVSPELVDKCRQRPRHPWLDRKEMPVLLGVGRLTEQKDFRSLIRAFQAVRERLACRLIILGEGACRPELEAQVITMGLDQVVDLPGFVRNPLAYMARSDVFVLSSRWEGFGIVLVEALAAGTPIVSTDCPGGPREILAEGTFGRLVPVGDVERMAHSIVDVLTEGPDRNALRERAADYEIGKVIEEYRRLIFGDRVHGRLEVGSRNAPALLPIVNQRR